jgi:hypothetical protein
MGSHEGGVGPGALHCRADQPVLEFLTNYPLFSLLKASWQAAVLILLVLAVQRVFGRRLSPRWRYGLWLLVL